MYDLHQHLVNTHACLVRKTPWSVLDFFEWLKNYSGMILITKERRRLGSPLCLKLGSLCGGGE